MPKLHIYINGHPVVVIGNKSVFQACSEHKLNIPRFCFHEKLIVSGNCRMCLVEIAKFPKPIVSCATPLVEGISIFTDTPLVKKARESVLEFMLINHPLDCPICDQAGECDLQNQSFFVGASYSRFFFRKRGVSNKKLNTVILGVFTRCIHCTRCTRFLCDYVGLDLLGLTGRGSSTEISCFVNKNIISNASGNIIDLCPVGCLTDKPFIRLNRC